MPLSILDAMPIPADFYQRYWNRQPFVVRAAIPENDLAALISADELAGLAMEDAPQSRMVKTAGDQQNWSCCFGPFSEEDFTTAGEKDWTLLIQNVEQFHPETGALLRHFNFTPRWLMDDIMVSYSEPGGSVGPHIDNYHVFLVQGQGKRHWKVGREAIYDETYIQGLEFRILEHGFEGDDVELSLGDVLYLPPRFGHEGTTLESALTFSVGFLGPKLSELMSSYGQYLAQFEDFDPRYVGDGLTTDSTGFQINVDAVDTIRDGLARNLNAKAFSQWLVEFFTENSHEDFGIYTEREDVLDPQAFKLKLQTKANLVKPEYVKMAATQARPGTFYLGVDSHSFLFDSSLFPWVQKFMKEEKVTTSISPDLLDDEQALGFLLELYNHQVLEFEN